MALGLLLRPSLLVRTDLKAWSTRRRAILEHILDPSSRRIVRLQRGEAVSFIPRVSQTLDVEHTVQEDMHVQMSGHAVLAHPGESDSHPLTDTSIEPVPNALVQPLL